MTSGVSCALQPRPTDRAPQTRNRDVRPRAAEAAAYRDSVKELARQFPDEGPPCAILARLQRTGVRLSQKQQLEIMRLVDTLLALLASSDYSIVADDVRLQHRRAQSTRPPRAPRRGA